MRRQWTFPKDTASVDVDKELLLPQELEEEQIRVNITNLFLAIIIRVKNIQAGKVEKLLDIMDIYMHIVLSILVQGMDMSLSIS